LNYNKGNFTATRDKKDFNWTKVNQVVYLKYLEYNKMISRHNTVSSD